MMAVPSINIIIPQVTHQSHSLKHRFQMRPFHSVLLSVILLIHQPAFAAGTVHGTTADKLDIVATIRPLYSLVAHLTTGVSEPKLLLRQQADAHHVSLRPSQRRMLADADIIIRMSPRLSPFLDDIVAQQAYSKLVDASRSPGISILQRRTSGHGIQHDGREGHGADDEDPHIWLSASNARAISNYLARVLKQTLPGHADRIDVNLAALLARIDLTEREIQETFALGQVTYIAQHDAFQYFDKEAGIRFVAAVTLDEEAGASLRHLRELGKLIRQEQVNCLAYQRPRQSMVDTLTDRYRLISIELDPLGLSASSDRDAWFEIMQNMRSGFRACLPPNPVSKPVLDGQQGRP